MPRRPFRQAAMGGAAPDGGGGGGEGEDDDLLPLSKIFPKGGSSKRSSSRGISKKRNAPTRTTVGGSVGSDALGGLAVPRIPDAPEEGFSAGDLVWAKAFPYTWWPGWVQDRRGSVTMVSFFGIDRSLWFGESEICCFEENYLRMSKMAGARLADEVDLALAELSRRTALGLRCDCQGPIEGVDRSLLGLTVKVKKEFKPADSLGFLLDKAICAWVDNGEIVGAARVAAQFNAYRRHVLVAEIGEVKEGFCPAKMLDFVRRVALSAWVSEIKADSTARTVAQVNAYRRFLSVNPDWVYQRTVEEGDCSHSDHSEGSHSEISFGSLSEEEIVDADSLYEIELEEHSTFQQEVQSDGDICMINRVDFIIPSSDEEFESLEDNKMKDSGDWTGSAGMGCYKRHELKVKKASVSDDSPVCKDTPTWNQRVNNGVLPSDLEQSSSQCKITAKDSQDDKLDVANNVTGKVKLPSAVDFGKGNIPPDPSDDIADKSKTICRSIFVAEGFPDRKANQPVVSDISCKVHKTDDLSTVKDPNACFLKFKTEISSHLSLKPQLKAVTGIFHGEEGDAQALSEMLWHLYSLALDPFYLESQNLMSLHQALMNYRVLAFQNIHDPFCTVDSAKDNQKAGAPEIFGPDQMICTHNGTTEKQPNDKVGDICDGSNEAQLWSPTCDDIELQTRNMFLIEAPHIPLVADDGVMFQSSNKVSFAGKIVIDKRYTADSDSINFISRSTSSVNGDCEGVIKKRFDQTVSPHSSFNLHETHSLGSEAKLDANPSIQYSLNSGGKKDDFCAKFSVASDTCERVFSLGNSDCGVMEYQPSGVVCPAASITDNTGNNTKVTCSSAPPMCGSREGLHGKRRLEPVHPYFSKWHKTWPSNLAAKLYLSPLVMDTPNPPVRFQQSRVEDGSTGLPRSLHMKFPKDFNLPSKEEIEKIFGVFGPLDHSRTRVFFYTGAAKVVFVNPADAESAYNYVKNQKTFAQAGMRFWIDEHENFRRERDDNKALLDSGGERSSLNTKSCLKKPSIHANEDPKAKRSVRFAAYQSVKVVGRLG